MARMTVPILILPVQMVTMALTAILPMTSITTMLVWNRMTGQDSEADRNGSVFSCGRMTSWQRKKRNYQNPDGFFLM